MTKELLKNIEERTRLFEANFLDGDKIGDCGNAMFTASGVMDVVDFFLSQIATAERKAGREEMVDILDEQKKRFRCGACDGAKVGHTQCCQCIADIKSKIGLIKE